MYLTGETISDDFPTTPGAFDTTPAPAFDVFVTKLSLRPATTPGCSVTGGGRITSANGDLATFSHRVSASDAGVLKGRVNYTDHGRAERLKLRSTAIDALVCDGRDATIFGTWREVDFRVDVTDGGQPGRSDTYRIRLGTGYDSGVQTLGGGNIRVR